MNNGYFMEKELLKEDRLNYFDNLRGILIILVIIGHIGGDNTSFSSDGNIFLQSIECFIYYFHMPLMFFISGLFSKNTAKCREKAFFDLFIPYIVFQIIYGFIIFALNHNLSYLLNPFYPAPALWYLLALFVFRFILHDVIRIRLNFAIVFLMAFFSIFFIGLSHDFAMNRIFANFIFFLVGYYINPKQILALKNRVFSKKRYMVVGGIITVILIGAIYISTFYILKNEYISFSNLLGLIGRSKNISNTGIGWKWGLVFSTVSIIVTVLLSIIIMLFVPEKKSYLTHIGGDTLPLYLSHMLIQTIYYIIQRRYFFFDNWAINYILSFVPTILCIVVFSSNLYRKVFHAILNKIKSILKNPKLE